MKLILLPCLLFYGYQVDLLELAVPMALLWQSQFFIQRRWALTKKDLYQISDLTNIALLAVLLFLFNNRTEYHFLLTLFQWLPILFFPLVLIINFSTTERLSLDILFFSLRKQKQTIQEDWQQDYILFALLLLASASNTESGGYYIGISFFLLASMLYQQKPKRQSLLLWLTLTSIVFGTTILVQHGIRSGHIKIKQEMEVWISNWIQRRNNPLRTRTTMGSIGELKLSDRIIFRLQVDEDVLPPALLQEAIYDLPSGDTWTLMQTEFVGLEPVGDFQWQINKPYQDTVIAKLESSTDAEARIFLEFEQSYALVPVPPGIQTINQIPAKNILQNLTGSLKATDLVRSPGYKVSYRNDISYRRPPEPADLYIPDNYNAILDRTKFLKQLDTSQPLLSLEQFFQPYRYSLYQETEGALNAFDNFLSKTRAGHCEFFATASVLILRKMGIPARYVVGYAVQEYDPLFDMYIIRQRHAHAWAQAYVNGHWQIVDQTPSQWLDFEADQQLVIQPLFDLLTNSLFAFNLFWYELDSRAFEKYYYLIGLLLTGFVGLRIYRSKQVVLRPATAEAVATKSAPQGSDSPFYALERLLIDHINHFDVPEGISGKEISRKKSETFEAWLDRIDVKKRISAENLQLLSALELHNSLRFDYLEISTSDLKRLETIVLQLRQTLENNKS